MKTPPTPGPHETPGICDHVWRGIAGVTSLQCDKCGVAHPHLDVEDARMDLSLLELQV